MDTEWRPISRHEGDYEVSLDGRVRSLDGVITMSNGRTRKRRGKVLKPYRSAKYQAVDLKGERNYVHHLVAEAFIGPRPEGALVLHRDDDEDNNCAENLRYGDHSSNYSDSIKNGCRDYDEFECPNGHPRTRDNVYATPRGDHVCRPCDRERQRKAYRQKFNSLS